MPTQKIETAIIPAAAKPPALGTITPLSKAVGNQPPAWNLKDHPEMDGVQYIVTDVKVREGDQSDYVIMHGFKVPPTGEPGPNDALIVITGAANILERITPARDLLPVVGTFRKSGRAWFFD